MNKQSPRLTRGFFAIDPRFIHENKECYFVPNRNQVYRPLIVSVNPFRAKHVRKPYTYKKNYSQYIQYEIS